MKLVVATQNKHKLEEIREALRETGYDVIGMDDIGFNNEIEETGTTFLENARIKAMAVSGSCEELVMADDSGLVIDALHGEPGIYSARYLGHDTPYPTKNALILERMQEMEQRTARFVCAISICKQGKVIVELEEVFEGEIAKQTEGEHGFGYDPIFYFPPLGKSAAAMTMAEKNKVSHRGKAMQRVAEVLRNL